MYVLGTDGSKILKQIFKISIGGGNIDWIDLAQERQVAGSCERGNELPCSTKMWEIS